MCENWMSEEAQFLDAYRQLSETEQVIFSAGVKALNEGRLTMEELAARIPELIARDRAGEGVLLSELDFADDCSPRQA